MAKVMEKITGDESEEEDEVDIDRLLDSVRAENSPSSKPGSGDVTSVRSGSGGSGKSVTRKSAAARKDTLPKSRSDTALSKYSTASTAGSKRSVKKKPATKKP